MRKEKISEWFQFGSDIFNAQNEIVFSHWDKTLTIIKVDQL